MGSRKTDRTPLRRCRHQMGKSIAQVATDLGVTPQYVCAQEARSSGGAKGYTLAFYSLYRAEIEQLGYSLEDLLRGRRIRSVA